MDENPTNPHVYPRTSQGDPGITLRDKFALEVMAALVGRPGTSHPAESIAENAYYLADAMLKQRKK